MNDDHMHPADETTLDDLGTALPRSGPPAGLRDSILAAAADTPQDASGPEAPMAEVIPLRPRHRGVLTTFAAAACAAAIAVGITLAFTSGGGIDTVPATASAPVAAQGAATVTGTASLYRPNEVGGTLRVSLTDVPTAPPGHHYEVWVLPKGSDTMTAVGSFTPASGDVTLDLPLPAPGDYRAVDISVQRNNGSPEHSGTSLAGASFI